MAKKKKLFTYNFVDCEKKFNSSIIVTCTKTKEKVKMYHRQLVKLIKNKYNNNYGLFIASYIKKGNKPSEDKYDENGDNNPSPEGYRKYLIIAYNAYKNKKEGDGLSDSERAAKLSFINDCFSRRYEGSLEAASLKMEQVYNDNNENIL